jgi:hypothetical protein
MGSPLAGDDRRLRDACRLAVGVAIEGEAARPRIPAPTALVPVLGFRRLTATSYRLIARVVDEDDAFRARVAEAADEDEVGRVGWLWLQRPDGWVDEVAALGGGDADAGGGGRGRSRARSDDGAKHRRAREDAERERRRASEEAASLRRELARARDEGERLAAAADALRDERNAAMRRAKGLEADLAAARGELRVARAAATEAEQELAALRASASGSPGAGGSGGGAAGRLAGPSGSGGSGGSSGSAGSAGAGGSGGDGEVAALRARLDEALSAADGLRDLLAAALGVERLEPARPAPSSASASAPAPAEPARRDRARRGTRRPRRPLPPLPPGVFDGTPEAHRCLLSSPAPVVVVDGYNLARHRWSGLAPEEERRRVVALLEEAQARSGATIVVVFDGDASVVGPASSRRVRVVFSDTGETADHRIARLVEGLPADQPVVVVSSDRAVAAHARGQGAVAMGSGDAFAALGR